MRRGSIFWGALLLLAGILFLLSNLGFIALNVWDLLWPIFLISLGLSFLWGYFFRPSPKVEHANVPLEGSRQARVRVKHGAGRLDIRSGAGNGDLVLGDFGGGVDVQTHRTGDELDVTLSVPAHEFPFMGWGAGTTLDWSVQLARDIPLRLELETGANQANLDLSDLVVRELRLQTGASSTDITFPTAAGETNAEMHFGAASVRVRIPVGVAAIIRTRGGLSQVNVDPNRFPRMGDQYQSPDYATALNKVNLLIESGVGSVDVR